MISRITVNFYDPKCEKKNINLRSYSTLSSDASIGIIAGKTAG